MAIAADGEPHDLRVMPEKVYLIDSYRHEKSRIENPRKRRLQRSFARTPEWTFERKARMHGLKGELKGKGCNAGEKSKGYYYADKTCKNHMCDIGLLMGLMLDRAF